METQTLQYPNAKTRPALRLVGTKQLPREDWLAVRKRGIGSYGAAAAMGLNPYKSQLYWPLGFPRRLPVKYRLINFLKRQNTLCCAQLYCLLWHAKHYTTGFVLSYSRTASNQHFFQAPGTIVAHTGHDNSCRVLASEFGY